jgi:hypothetical protein
VVKPSHSAGRNNEVGPQEHLYSAEYYVNTVSRDGRQYVGEIWRRSHVT